MPDTPEEAAYRAKVRAQLEKQKQEAEDNRMRTRIEAEEKARIEKKPLVDKAFRLGKTVLNEAISGWTGKKQKAKK